jgi:hypothetical protein
MTRLSRRSGGASLSLVLLAALAGACAHGQEGPPPDNSAQAIATVDARLKGHWKLDRFQPIEPLGPMLDTLLQFQYQNLAITLDGKRLVADSPGLHIDRAYQVKEAEGDRFKVVVWDDQGVPVESSCNFLQSGQVEASVRSDPWRGTATLRKVQ